MKKFLCFLGGLLCLLATALPLRAGWYGGVQTTDNSGVDIALTSPFKEAPSTGFMPVWVTIHNHSGAARSWEVTGEQSAYGRNVSGRPSVVQTIRAGKGETVRSLLLVPLDSQNSSGVYYYHRVSIQVAGYGVNDSSTSLPSGSVSGGANSAYLGLGDTLATPVWGSLEKEYKDHGSELRGSPVDVALLPTDWRGLSGLDALWLTEAEYTGLDAERRAAIRDWTNHGGTFLLCSQSLPPALRPALGLPSEGDEGHPGFGRVLLVPWDGKTPPEVAAIRSRLDDVNSKDVLPPYQDSKDWPLVKTVGAIPVNAAFLIGFITVFALVIGPLNLFVLADAKRRHRLFWTTPLIATVASLLLMGVIVLQDGFGGHGARAMLTLLLPDQRRAVVVQDQVSRTGILFSGRFTAKEDLTLTQLAASGTSAKALDQAGRTYSGDWFSSHNVQAQRVEAIVPSRAEVQVFPPAGGGGPNPPPTVVSSIPATLRELHYTDPSGHHWRAENLRTGEKVVLQDDHTPREAKDEEGSPLLLKLQERVRGPGSFHAVAADGPFLDTLPSIHWRNQKAVFVGPVTFAR